MNDTDSLFHLLSLQQIQEIAHTLLNKHSEKIVLDVDGHRFLLANTPNQCYAIGLHIATKKVCLDSNKPKKFKISLQAGEPFKAKQGIKIKNTVTNRQTIKDSDSINKPDHYTSHPSLEIKIDSIRKAPIVNTISDGSTAKYYELPKGATQLQDLISFKNMNGQIAEILRAVYRYGEVSHSPKIRDIKKIIFYAEAEIDRIERYESDSQRQKWQAPDRAYHDE